MPDEIQYGGEFFFCIFCENMQCVLNNTYCDIKCIHYLPFIFLIFFLCTCPVAGFQHSAD